MLSVGTEVSYRGESLIVLGVIRDAGVVIGSPNDLDGTPERYITIEQAEQGAQIAVLEDESVSFARIWDRSGR